MKQLALFVVGALTIGASPANAHWQYTHWEMSVKEVEAASKGRARPTSKSGEEGSAPRTLLVAPYAAQGFQFQAFFKFDYMTRGLVEVELSAQNPKQCSLIIQSLKTSYGPPEHIYPGGRITWIDRTRQNAIGVVDRPTECFIQYNGWSTGGL